MFSKLGVNGVDAKRKVNYIPLAVIKFEDETKKKVYLSSIVSDKKSIKQVTAGDTFICLLIDEEYKVYNLDGELQGSISSSEYGTLLKVNDDSFILLKETTITFINDKGEVSGSRKLTENELNAINES